MTIYQRKRVLRVCVQGVHFWRANCDFVIGHTRLHERGRLAVKGRLTHRCLLEQSEVKEMGFVVLLSLSEAERLAWDGGEEVQRTLDCRNGRVRSSAGGLKRGRSIWAEAEAA